jgi:hypothetical protein
MVVGSGTPGITLFAPTSERSESATSGAPLYFTENTAGDLDRLKLDVSVVRLVVRSIPEKLLVFSVVLRFAGASSGFAWAVMPNTLTDNAIVNSNRLSMRGKDSRVFEIEKRTNRSNYCSVSGQMWNGLEPEKM